MKTNTEFPFVAVHLKGKAPIFGYMYSDDKWSISMRWMTNNDDSQGRNVQINHHQIEYIESLDISEAPWNNQGEVKHKELTD